MSGATALPGASVNDLTDPDVVEAVSGNAVLNGVPVTVEPLAVGRRRGRADGGPAPCVAPVTAVLV